MSKYSTGPWTACFTVENGSTNISFEIAASPHGSCRPIVECRWPWEDARKEHETLTANAYLIASSPDLLEACKLALTEIEETKKLFAEAMPILVQIAPSLKKLDMGSDSEFIETLRKAIAKAEGREC